MSGIAPPSGLFVSYVIPPPKPFSPISDSFHGKRVDSSYATHMYTSLRVLASLIHLSQIINALWHSRLDTFIYNFIYNLSQYNVNRPYPSYFKYSDLLRLRKLSTWPIFFPYKVKLKHCKMSKHITKFYLRRSNSKLCQYKETSTQMYTSFYFRFNFQYGPYAHFGYWTLVSDL